MSVPTVFQKRGHPAPRAPRNIRRCPSVGAHHITDLTVFSLMVLMSRQELSRLSQQTAGPAVRRQPSPGGVLIMNHSDTSVLLPRS